MANFRLLIGGTQDIWVRDRSDISVWKAFSERFGIFQSDGASRIRGITAAFICSAIFEDVCRLVCPEFGVVSVNDDTHRYRVLCTLTVVFFCAFTYNYDLEKLVEPDLPLAPLW